MAGGAMRVRFGNFILDSDRRELLRDGVPVRVPPKALRLLEVLVARRPKAVSQGELYDALWPDTFVDKANLHNVVYQLRAALDDGEHRVIRTAYGFGFLFGVPAVDVEPAAVGGWELVVADEGFELHEGPNIVGRERDAAVRIDSGSISRHHARITIASGHVTLEDLESKNGTYVGGRRIHTVDLQDGDKILFGMIMATLRAVRPSRSTETIR